MEKSLVDIFIPVYSKYAHKFPAALYSALTQTYIKVRILLFLDGIDPLLEEVVHKWFYTDSEKEKFRYPLEKVSPQKSLNLKNIHYECCTRGIIIRNTAGPSGSAHIGRQWLFEWPGKAPFVKMLDADDILIPRCLEIMMKYFTPDTDGVFCPLTKSSAYRYASSNYPDPQNKQIGSGCMLLRKEMMHTMVKEGFKWPEERGHDKEFLKFMQNRKEKFNLKVTKEDFLYLYIKGDFP